MNRKKKNVDARRRMQAMRDRRKKGQRVVTLTAQEFFLRQILAESNLLPNDGEEFFADRRAVVKATQEFFDIITQEEIQL